jgi:hypothetical protein
MGWRKSLQPAETGIAAARAPDYGEALTAWRVWEVEDVDGAPRLRSLYRNCFWPVGTALEAHCEAQRLRLWRGSRHAAPTAACTCGIHAVPFEFLQSLAQQDRLLPPGRSIVIGTVSLWGEVVECERGWRAELAYPSRLFMPRPSSAPQQSAAGLGDYGVPVELLTRSAAETVDELEAAVAGRGA